MKVISVKEVNIYLIAYQGVVQAILGITAQDAINKFCDRLFDDTDGQISPNYNEPSVLHSDPERINIKVSLTYGNAYINAKKGTK